MAGVAIVENADPAGIGLNDPTPATPVGGNPEGTRGAQAMRAVTHAAERWAAHLHGDVPLRVSVSFAALDCDAVSGVVGSAVPRTFARDAPGLRPGVWYPIALANHLAGSDLVPGEPDIDARFNGRAGSAGCLEGAGFYLGLDANPGGGIDLVTVALHELAHGLGMTTLVNLNTGALHQGSPDVFSLLVFDERMGLLWPDLDDAGRAASVRRFQELSWGGPAATLLAGQILTMGVPTLTLGAPVDRIPLIGLSAFGPRLSESGVAGAVSRVEDSVGSPFDGCEIATPIPGRIALIEAGGCDDTTKVLSAQAAGAVAAIVVDDRLVQPPLPLSGPNDGRVTIPAVRIGQDDASALRLSLASDVAATLRVDPERARGTSPSGRVYLSSQDPPQVGRSVTHWDPSVTPDLLMEADPRPGHDLDLTLALLTDLGWRAVLPDGGMPDSGPVDGGTVDGGNEDAADSAADAPTSTGGGPGGGPGGGGAAPLDAGAGGSRPPDAMAGSGGRGSGGSGDGGAPADAGDAGIPRAGRDEGCGCRVASRGEHATGPRHLAFLALLGLAALRFRPRRGSASLGTRIRG